MRPQCASAHGLCSFISPSCGLARPIVACEVVIRAAPTCRTSSSTVDWCTRPSVNSPPAQQAEAHLISKKGYPAKETQADLRAEGLVHRGVALFRLLELLLPLSRSLGSHRRCACREHFPLVNNRRLWRTQLFEERLRLASRKVCMAGLWAVPATGQPG